MQDWMRANRHYNSDNVHDKVDVFFSMPPYNRKLPLCQEDMPSLPSDGCHQYIIDVLKWQGTKSIPFDRLEFLRNIGFSNHSVILGNVDQGMRSLVTWLSFTMLLGIYSLYHGSSNKCCVNFAFVHPTIFCLPTIMDSTETTKDIRTHRNTRIQENPSEHREAWPSGNTLAW